MSRQPASRYDGAQGNESFLGLSPLDSGIGGAAATRRALADSRHRSRRLGVALSLGLHAAILAWLLHATAIPAGFEQTPDPASLDVTAVLSAAPSEEAVRKPAPEPPQPAAPPRSAAARPPVRSPGEVSLPSRAGIRRKAPTEEPSIEQAAGATATAPVPGVPGEVLPAATEGPPAAAEDSLRLYGEAVRTLILNHKPTGIRLRGTVGLTFSLSPDGRLIAATVSTSSGSEILDRAALAALQRAAPFPPSPEAASPQQLTFSIPFQFR